MDGSAVLVTFLGRARAQWRRQNLEEGGAER